MQWPKNPLNIIIYNAIVSGKLTAYKDDSLNSFRSPEEFVNYFSDKKPDKKLIDPNGDPEDPSNFYMDTILIKLAATDIKKYKVVEDWIFDKENILSFSKNAIMLGKKMKGKVYGIICNNKIQI